MMGSGLEPAGANSHAVVLDLSSTSGGAEGGGPANQPVDLIRLGQQQFGQVGPPGDPRDEGDARHPSPPITKPPVTLDAHPCSLNRDRLEGLSLTPAIRWLGIRRGTLLVAMTEFPKNSQIPSGFGP